VSLRGVATQLEEVREQNVEGIIYAWKGQSDRSWRKLYSEELHNLHF
jgi:hypothetical protein